MARFLEVKDFQLEGLGGRSICEIHSADQESLAVSRTP